MTIRERYNIYKLVGRDYYNYKLEFKSRIFRKAYIIYLNIDK